MNNTIVHSKEKDGHKLPWKLESMEMGNQQINPSQLVDVVSKVFNNREQKQGEVKWNAAFLVTALK